MRGARTGIGAAMFFVACIGAACGGGGDAPGPAGLGSPPVATASPAPTTAPAPTPSTPPAPTATTPPSVDPPPTASSCFKDLAGPVAGPDYDQFKPTIAKGCSGTHHQNITGVEKVVFLGDSVTVGTPPTPIDDFYAVRLTNALKTTYPTLETASCAGWGAQTNDLLDNDNQLGHCFPSPSEPKKTLIVMTMGGNDIAGWAKGQIATTDAMTEADTSAANLRAAIAWVQAPGRFPAGVYFLFANVYEYTDTSGDLMSCPAASLSGMKGNWPQGAPAVVHLQEQYMKIAVETGTDMIFLLEHFCGHGYRRDDPSLQCYRGPGAELWFDLTCMHPTPNGHGQIADLFLDVIQGK